MESEPVAETFFNQNKMLEKCRKCVSVYKKLMSLTIIWFGYYHIAVNNYSASVVIDCNIITDKFYLLPLI
jgi:ABC-type bacteriocin/lantibiotic exporter with double-glycine peptidase domain